MLCVKRSLKYRVKVKRGEGKESRNEKEDKIVLLGTRFTSITHITYNPYNTHKMTCKSV